MKKKVITALCALVVLGIILSNVTNRVIKPSEDF